MLGGENPGDLMVVGSFGGERQLTQATLLPPLISCQGSLLAKPHGSRRAQKLGWWPTRVGSLEQEGEWNWG